MKNDLRDMRHSAPDIKVETARRPCPPIFWESRFVWSAKIQPKTGAEWHELKGITLGGDVLVP